VSAFSFSLIPTPNGSGFVDRKTMFLNSSKSHIGPIEGELSATVSTTLESFGQHKLSHPVNTFLAPQDHVFE
jgi:hypothetical protein